MMNDKLEAFLVGLVSALNKFCLGFIEAYEKAFPAETFGPKPISKIDLGFTNGWEKAFPPGTINPKLNTKVQKAGIQYAERYCLFTECHSCPLIGIDDEGVRDFRDCPAYQTKLVNVERVAKLDKGINP